MLHNLKCGNNAAIKAKKIREELMEYFISKKAISWQRNQSLRIFEIIIFALATWTPS